MNNTRYLKAKHQRPWTIQERGYQLEGNLLLEVYQRLPPIQQEIIETMRLGFITETGIKGMGIQSFLELLFKIKYKKELDAMATSAWKAL